MARPQPKPNSVLMPILLMVIIAMLVLVSILFADRIITERRAEKAREFESFTEQCQKMNGTTINTISGLVCFDNKFLIEIPE